MLFPLAAQSIRAEGGRRGPRRPRPTHRGAVGAAYVLTDAPLDRKTYFTGIEKAVVDHLYRARTIRAIRNPELKLVVRAGETPEEFAARCSAAADEGADRSPVAPGGQVRGGHRQSAGALGAARDRVAQAEAAESTRRQSDMVTGAGRCCWPADAECPHDGARHGPGAHGRGAGATLRLQRVRSAGTAPTTARRR